MKTVKRVLAMIGVLFLLALYASTVILAVIGSETSLTLLKIAIYSTVVVPVLLWAYSFIYRMLKGKDNDENQNR